MDSLNYQSKEFKFNYKSECQNYSFQHSITIPFDTNITVREYGFLLMKLYNLPRDSLENDLMIKLQIFYDKHIDQIQYENIDYLMKNYHKFSLKFEKFLEKIKNTPQLTTNNIQQIKNKNDNDDEEFYLMYHKIIHSGKLTQQLIQLENHNSDVIKNLIMEKDEFLQKLSTEQNKKIEDILISGKYSEKEINLLTQKNIAIAEMKRNEWLDKIRQIRNDQKREFYTWIKNIYEDLIDNDNCSTKIDDKNDNNQEESDKDISFLSDFVDVIIDDEFEMQESYTINLGSQLKTTHNLRLIAADMLKFCSNLYTTPHRIQTAMSLYSNSLSAVVLLADESLISTATKKSNFARMIMNTSENHFPEFNQQCDLIKLDLDHRLKKPLLSNKQKNGHQNYRLKTGDIYITKHSNLSEAHVVFHIVTEDSIRQSEINSRHPIILGLRNILKIVYIYDISNIYIPLLLINEINEDITIQWCLKRAELILKCVKGFMIEMSSLLSIKDNENKTIQFVVPKEISQELFQNLSSIFPNVFRLSNPLFLTKNDL